MIRESKFFISKGLYAVDPDGLRTTPCGGNPLGLHSVRVSAVWFRRRRGVTVACIGELWDIMRDPRPTTVADALPRMTDGRYGSSCDGRWDGEGYWGAEVPGQVERHLAILRADARCLPGLPERLRRKVRAMTAFCNAATLLIALGAVGALVWAMLPERRR